MTKLLTLVICSLLLTITTATARPKGPTLYNASAAEIAQPPGTLIRYARTPLPLLYRAKAWKILYATRDYAGRPIASTGFVVLPDNAPARAQNRHFVAWAHPTIGVARQCAPTLRQTPVRAILGLNELVAMGYIVTATDYPGLGTVGPVGYLVGTGQAQAVIDSVRAAKQIPGIGGSNDYVLWGYSQGGHAALHGSLISADYAPELRLKGVAAVAPPTNLAALMLANSNSLAGNVLSSFALGSWSVKYGVPLTSLINSKTIQTIRAINANCIDKFEGEVDIFEAQSKLGNDFLPQRSLGIQPWRNIIAINSISGLSARVPALILQGGIDSIVKPKVTRTFVRNSCRNGAIVSYVELQGLGHGKAAAAGKIPATNWLNDRLAGKPAPSNCK
jgi:alpha-beta hydrolase superfamily lysophospholipase